MLLSEFARDPSRRHKPLPMDLRCTPIFVGPLPIEGEIRRSNRHGSKYTDALATCQENCVTRYEAAPRPYAPSTRRDACAAGRARAGLIRKRIPMAADSLLTN